jgi:hypothetical protein
MKKKWLAVIGVVILITTIATVAFAANPIKLYVVTAGDKMTQ